GRLRPTSVRPTEMLRTRAASSEHRTPSVARGGGAGYHRGMSSATTLSESLRNRGDAVLASWTHRFERSQLRFQRAVEARVHAGLMVPMIEALAVAVSGGTDPPTHRQP